MKITRERAIEILDPEHRERYADIEIVNEACRMGAEALKAQTRGKWQPGDGYIDTAVCSECGSVYDAADPADTTVWNAETWKAFCESYRFCPACGARMEDGADG